jgi:hypothetical protein
MNLKNLFKGLNFEEYSHTYTKDGIVYPSASSIVARTYEKFNAGKIAPFVANKRGIPVHMVLDEWEQAKNESIEKGNMLHSIGEMIAISKQRGYPVKSLLDFWYDYIFDLDAKVLGTEVRLYSEEYRYAGTADLVISNPVIDFETGEVTGTETIIYDYKTNKDLYKNYKGKRMKAPFEEFLDCPFSHYAIQQNLYKIAFEEQGIEIGGMELVWLKSEGYELVPIVDMTEEIKAWLQKESISQL